MATDVVHVCVSCRYHAEERFKDGKRGGQILFERLQNEIASRGSDLTLKPVECMSLCRSYSALAFTGKQKMTMVFARLNVADELDTAADAVFQYADLYRKKRDGRVPRDERPDFLKDKLVVRVPSFDSSGSHEL